MESLAPEGIAISVITYGEVSEGVMFSGRPAQNQRRWHEFLAPFDIVNVTAPIAEVWAEIRGTLRARGLPTPDNDLLIAATALYFDMTVFTNSRRHFERVDGLRLLTPPVAVRPPPQ
jgi:predicted nucleic acid-binding protein